MMNLNMIRFLCFAIVLLSACTEGEQWNRTYEVARFSDQINQAFIFQAENRVYVTTSHGSMYDQVTDVYQVDLLNGTKSLIFSTEGFPSRFIVSPDEKLIAIAVFTQSPTASSTERLELFDMNTKTKTVLRAVQASMFPYGFDSENKTLLYNIYQNTENNMRKIDLASGEDVLISNDIAVDINPVNGNIMVNYSGETYFMDWSGAKVGESITGFFPRFFSHDGKKIIGYQRITKEVNGRFEYYQDVIRYTIATGEIEVLTGGEAEFSAVSMSADENFLLCLATGPGMQYSYDLFVVDVTTLEKNRLMSTDREEHGIGFFDDGRQVLFKVSGDDNFNKLFATKVN